ncbi:MAG: glycosyl transferase family 2 [Latescibacteria bacterium DG_63]|nr:MAG: glycosyl transferase family 2 [Latescibacteria bacterium DG_63]
MPPGQALDKTAAEKIKEIGTADVVVGIPSFNNARTISHVVRAVSAGLAKYFPDTKNVLVNSDGASSDGTPQIVMETQIEDLSAILVRHKLYSVHKIVTPYHGIPGKGSALRTIIEIGTSLGAKAMAVVDSDLRSITPEWVELLVGPVLREGFDYVTPLYARHKYDGSITNSIVYPVARALYGKRIRQPIGGDFGFSGKLGSHYLSHKVWDTDVARYGIDIWMTTTALAGGYKVCEAFLGAKLHDEKDPGADLSSMLTQVVSSVFGLMETYYSVWKDVSGSVGVPLFGMRYGVGVEPINVNIERMIESFRHGLEHLSPLWARFLEQDVLKKLEFTLDTRKFKLADELWVRLIYDFALAYHERKLNREHLLKSMTPLYLGKVASLFTEMRDSHEKEVEDRIEALCMTFETMKDYLAEKWKP